ncbi:sushi, von Willebrand factor type A, EGF and pentraxin domain-containing protein 1-like [Sycon ciliatum]|uniref:sushi, von Willebrand factor type A, EGF and pentraxin domain-containing protein 1-like n=1 Tax=Sycon ciliatum TaxID=27933 RepID=UPI0031F636F8
MAFRMDTIALFIAICLALPTPTPAKKGKCAAKYIPNGVFPTTIWGEKDKKWGTTLHVQPVCDTGFEPSNIPRCSIDGSWLMRREIEYCTPKDINCPVPRIDNGGSRETSVRFPGTALYSCSAADGYILVGEAKPWCTAQGTLSALPQCKFVSCPLPSIENGRKQRDTIGYSQTAQYSCIPGYRLVGNRPTCSKGGTLGPVPRCVLVVCAVTALNHGSSTTQSVQFPGAAQYNCTAGYLLQGDARPKCTTAGTLSSLPKCRPINCSVPDIANGIAKFTSIRYPQTTRYHCNRGFSMLGDRKPRCTSHGNLTSLPRCIRKNATGLTGKHFCPPAGSLLRISIGKYDYSSAVELCARNNGTLLSKRAHEGGCAQPLLRDLPAWLSDDMSPTKKITTEGSLLATRKIAVICERSLGRGMNFQCKNFNIRIYVQLETFEKASRICAGKRLKLMVDRWQSNKLMRCYLPALRNEGVRLTWIRQAGEPHTLKTLYDIETGAKTISPLGLETAAFICAKKIKSKN